MTVDVCAVFINAEMKCSSQRATAVLIRQAMELQLGVKIIWVAESDTSRMTMTRLWRSRWGNLDGDDTDMCLKVDEL